jgi:hypothetical protein
MFAMMFDERWSLGPSARMDRIDALPKTRRKSVMQKIEMTLAQANTQGAAW